MNCKHIVLWWIKLIEKVLLNMALQETGRKISHLYQLFMQEYANFGETISVNVTDYNVFFINSRESRV